MVVRNCRLTRLENIPLDSGEFFSPIELVPDLIPNGDWRLDLYVITDKESGGFQEAYLLFNENKQVGHSVMGSRKQWTMAGVVFINSEQWSDWDGVGVQSTREQLGQIFPSSSYRYSYIDPAIPRIAVTAILAKIGVKDIDSNLATAIRTVVILFFAWGIVLTQGAVKQLGLISRNSLIFLILSGIATGLSWLFYFRALQLGEASRVSPIDKLSLVLTIILAAIILKEKITPLIFIDAVLISVGAILIGMGG